MKKGDLCYIAGTEIGAPGIHLCIFLRMDKCKTFGHEYGTVYNTFTGTKQNFRSEYILNERQAKERHKQLLAIQAGLEDITKRIHRNITYASNHSYLGQR